MATFYTMYKRHDMGEYHVGICINPGCGLLGGDELWQRACGRLGIGNDEVTPDGRFSLERIECQAACTHAPVVTVNWEYLDDQTPESLDEVLDTLADGGEVTSTRGPVIRSFRDTERTLAGFDDGLAYAPAVDDKMLAGLRVARERGWRHRRCRPQLPRPHPERRIPREVPDMPLTRSSPSIGTSRTSGRSTSTGRSMGATGRCPRRCPRRPTRSSRR